MSCDEYYILFGGDSCMIGGGAHDVRRKSSNLDGLIELAQGKIDEDSWDWWHILSLEEMAIVKENPIED